MPFASTSLASAIASIRAYRPKTIALEVGFAETPAGVGFIEQVEPLVRNANGILLVVEHDGQWIATPRGNGRHEKPRSEPGEGTGDEALRALDALLDEGTNGDVTPV